MSALRTTPGSSKSSPIWSASSATWTIPTCAAPRRADAGINCLCGVGVSKSHRVARFDRILYGRHLPAMQTVSYTEARNRLASLIEAASRDREAITITRNGAATAVLLAPEEYAAMEETLHLLSTPANVERIRRGLADYAAGKLQSGQLCD